MSIQGGSSSHDQITSQKAHFQVSPLGDNSSNFKMYGLWEYKHSGNSTIKPGDKVYSWFETRLAEQVVHSDFKQKSLMQIYNRII